MFCRRRAHTRNSGARGGEQEQQAYLVPEVGRRELGLLAFREREAELGGR